MATPKEEDKNTMIARYVEGYLKYPETAREIAAAEASAIALFEEIESHA